MILNNIRFVILSCGLLTQPVCAASFLLDAKESKPFYQSSLPIAVYQQTRSSGLQDLTITNAANEQVPYALVPYEELHPETTSRIETKPLPLFPIKVNALGNPNDLRIQLEKSADKTTVNITSNEAEHAANTVFLVDIGSKHPPLQELTVAWQGGENTLHNIQVLSSNDLKEWTYVGYGTLLNTLPSGESTQQQLELPKAVDDPNSIGDDAKLNQTLSHNNITLDREVVARYLQIRPSDPADNGALRLTQIQANYRILQTIAPQALWQELRFVSREEDDKAGLVNIDFESLGHYPADRFKVKLPQTNTVTKVAIFVRNATNKPWTRIADTPIYRYSKDQPYSPESLITPTDARFWRLQFDQSGGGIGAENPSLNMGWLPPAVVWNARGEPPYTLHVGENPSIVNTIPITTMLQGYSAESLKNLPVANLITNQATQMTANQNEPSTSIEPTSAWISPPDYKTWLLWGGLTLGVLLLAGMAYSLLKSEGKK